MKESRIGWLVNDWPLITRKMRRGDCVQYLKDKKLPVPPKSACIGCPYHSDDYWRVLKRDNPAEFEDACQFDEQIRRCRAGLKAPVYLHRSCKPLREIEFRDEPDFFPNECEGHCGL